MTNNKKYIEYIDCRIEGLNDNDSIFLILKYNHYVNLHNKCLVNVSIFKSEEQNKTFKKEARKIGRIIHSIRLELLERYKKSLDNTMNKE